jgi:hypothetical protein
LGLTQANATPIGADHHATARYRVVKLRALDLLHDPGTGGITVGHQPQRFDIEHHTALGQHVASFVQ